MNRKLIISIATFCLISIIVYLIQAQNPTPKNITPTKQIVITTPQPTNTLNPIKTYNTYAKQWKQVIEHEKNGLPKSALKVVKNIYQEALNDNNHPQQIKAMLYIGKYTQQIEENGLIKNIAFVKKAIEEQFFPAKNISHSILANIYYKYYSQNIYRFYNRSETINNDTLDISTWSLPQILTEIKKHYKLSLINTVELQKIPIDNFEAILSQSKSFRYLKPSLFDFLIQENIHFFSNNIPQNEPNKTFKINNPDYFDVKNALSNIKLPKTDTNSFHYLTLKAYQKLEHYHKNDATPNSYIFCKLERLNYLYDQSTLPNKDTLYLYSLIEMQKQHKTDTFCAEINYYIAKHYYYHLKNLAKAHEYCQKTIAEYPGTLGSKNCLCLKNDIERIQFSPELEQVYTPQTPILTKINYQNTNKLYYKIIKYDNKKYHDLLRQYNHKNLIATFLKEKTISNDSITLPKYSDYKNHSTEAILPKLSNGHYVLLLSIKKNFSLDTNLIEYTSFWITNISFAVRNNGNKAMVYVTNRTTGEPLRNISVTTFEQEYNYKKQEYIKIKTNTKVTNQNGLVEFSIKNNHYHSTYYSFENNNDYFESQNAYYNYHYKTNKNKYSETIFFTDRSIYRPGQTVYFKGIMYEYNNENEDKSLLTNKKTTVKFFDVNYQEIAKQTFTTNEFGSFNGSFSIPQNLLNGRMTIQNEHHSISIQVEEYKRPTFEAMFINDSTEYQLNDTIKAMGEAIAYSGAKISDANVTYTISRQTHYLYPFYFWYRPMPPTNQKQLDYGKTKTDLQGKFEIPFKAIADEMADKKYNPSFIYTIEATITDINGETHTITKNIQIGYQSMVINTNLPKVINKNDIAKLSISSTDLNGSYIPAKGQINIYKLTPQKTWYIPKAWHMPDTVIIDKNLYKQSFPHIDYKSENAIANLKKEKRVFAQPFSTNDNKFTTLNTIKKWQPGRYLLEITSKDKYNNIIIHKKYFVVYNDKSKTPPTQEPLWVEASNTTVQPDDKIKLTIATACKNATILYEIEHKNKIISQKFITLSQEQNTYEIPVIEEYRGNFSIHVTLIKSNRLFNKTFLINVPYTNKELTCKFETFRDKMQPGSKETWSLLITDAQNNPANAEFLATMYDKSLDQFTPHSWYYNIYKYQYTNNNWNTKGFMNTSYFRTYQKNWRKQSYIKQRYFDQLNWFGLNIYGNYYNYNYNYSINRNCIDDEIMLCESVAIEECNLEQREDKSTSLRYKNKQEDSKPLLDNTNVLGGSKDKSEEELPNTGNTDKDISHIQARKNLQETAFFYPQLRTNKKGEIKFTFTMPESLTEWQFMGLAHTQDLKIGYTTQNVITQKELMVTPNLPRFFRQNDTMYISAKISNITDNHLTGTTQLILLNAFTMQPIDTKFKLTNAQQNITIPAKNNTVAKWQVIIPEDIELVVCKIVAKTQNHSDGEQHVLPILSNNMLVTETMPMPINQKGEKTIIFNKMANGQKSSTLKNYKLTLEFTGNPAWYAVQALPYLMEYPYECAEQTFSRYYANTLASHIANSQPQIKTIFEAWKNVPKSKALLSNLEKNESLKSAILAETPWVLEAKNETERKRRMGLLFDLNKMNHEQKTALRKLKNMQKHNGGWPWFKGMPENRYITQHIVGGLGKLYHLNILDIKKDKATYNMLKKAIEFLDNKIEKDYKYLLEYYKKEELENYHISYTQIHYLYVRSFFIKDFSIPNWAQEAFEYYKKQATTFWKNDNKYTEGMIALSLYRYGNTEIPNAIIKSLNEHALHNQEMGMYWKQQSGYYWYQAPIETQSLLIEAYSEIAKDTKAVNDMRIWLLKQKQTQDWKTTKATADAIYALLLNGGNWFHTEPDYTIQIGKNLIDPINNPEDKTETGTGYIKKVWEANEITPEMSQVTITKNNTGISWGAVYWQYFEQLDKITTHKTLLAIKKQLYKEIHTPTGKKIKPISDTTTINRGDKIIVRIEIQTDRTMNYIHLKDMRAACFEPEQTISSYHYQDGLGYYQTTKDASMNFFIDYLGKGTYILEYNLRTTQQGNFSNGITTIQCMYAPEYASHSEGIRVFVK